MTSAVLLSFLRVCVIMIEDIDHELFVGQLQDLCDHQCRVLKLVQLLNQLNQDVDVGFHHGVEDMFELRNQLYVLNLPRISKIDFVYFNLLEGSRRVFEIIDLRFESVADLVDCCGIIL